MGGAPRWFALNSRRDFDSFGAPQHDMSNSSEIHVVTNKFVTTCARLIRRDCLIEGIIARRLDEMVRGK